MTWPLDCVRPTESLARHTSFRIGGPAEWFAQPSSLEELIEVLQMARQLGLPVAVVGGGTNCLVADRGVRGLVVHLGPAFRTIQVMDDGDADQTIVRCGAAVLTQRLVRLAGQYGWEGVEVLAGLPGQVGGAVVMNAQYIGQFVEAVTVVTFEGAVMQLRREQITFSYRYTTMKPGLIVDVSLRFRRSDPAVCAQQLQQVLTYRNTTQELRLPSAGCAFKNPPQQSAGRLIDQAGLKGLRIGDARVSQRHANFIVNLGQATCEDVLSLMEYVQRSVRHTFGVWLEPEVRVLGERLDQFCAVPVRTTPHGAA